MHSPNLRAAASSTPSSPSFAASPAFSTLSEATFTSNSTNNTLLPPSPHPLPRQTLSDSIVEQLRKERDVECAPDARVELQAEGEEARLSQRLQRLDLKGEGGGGEECGCASPVSPELEGGQFNSLGGSGVGEATDGKGNEMLQPQGRPARPRRQSTSAVGVTFDQFGFPSAEAIQAACQCLLAGESGETVPLGDLIKQRGKVIVVFLRHLWCGLCAQYVTALRRATTALASVSSTTLSTTSDQTPPLYILLISSGSPSLIPIYRSRLECPFPLYVDQRRQTYKALGMTLKSLSAGKEKDKGSYITKTMLENVVSSAQSGLAMRANPGSQRQLGGEFVFTCEDDSDEIKCTYASRMVTTRGHSEVRDLFAAAGVTLTVEDEASIFGTSSIAG